MTLQCHFDVVVFAVRCMIGGGVAQDILIPQLASDRRRHLRQIPGKVGGEFAASSLLSQLS
jgi:hypothetical protein